MSASKPPPPVYLPVRRRVFAAAMRSMPPTVLTYRAMISSTAGVVCAETGRAAQNRVRKPSSGFRMVLPRVGMDCMSAGGKQSYAFADPQASTGRGDHHQRLTPARRAEAPTHRGGAWVR